MSKKLSPVAPSVASGKVPDYALLLRAPLPSVHG